MKVIHFLLGMPPLRKGGLPKYALSLIACQQKMGYDIEIVVPGPFDKSGRTQMKKWKDFAGIPCYRIVNGLPVSNEYGIRDISVFMKPLPESVFEEWFAGKQADIVHVHSLMGLPAEFLEAARKMSVKIVMTTHDFFGICPKITLFKKGELCDSCDWADCSECCQNAHSLKRLKFMVSDLYWWYCNQTWLMEGIHKGKVAPIKAVLQKLLSHASVEEKPAEKETVNYDALKAYYRKIFSCIDFFHFNSEQTAEIFQKNLGELRGEVIHIVNDDIHDDRVKKKYGEVLNIGYIGSKSVHKGFFFLADRLQKVYEEGRKNFVCHTFMLEDASEYPFVINHGPYLYGEQKEIFKMIDVLVVPSIWWETYGLVVPEAISNGVPVLVSEHVGAKTLLTKYPGIGRIFKVRGSEFADMIKAIYDDRTLLHDMNRQIMEIPFDFDMGKHAEEISDLYKAL